MKVTRTFEAHEARFTNTEQRASFNGMQVGEVAFFEKAVFPGPVDFVGVKVTGQFNADAAQFTKAEQPANFNRMQVGETAFFRKVVFAGPVSITDANFRNLWIEGSNEIASSWLSLNMDRTVINRELRIMHITLQKLLARALQVESLANLSGLTITGKAALQYGSFATLVFSDVSKLTTPKTVVLLDGMTYQHLDIGSGEGTALLQEEKWQDLLALVDKSAYSASVYLTLETFFRQRGYSKQADAVFVAQKRRERTEVLGGPRRVAWWKNIVLDKVTGYGRHPEWSMLWSMLVVGIGSLVFYKRGVMEPYKTDDAARPYNAFWYSFDLFAPVINLEAANVWRPKETDRWRTLYMRVQRIMGWLLVPLGLAAWTGILK